MIARGLREAVKTLFLVGDQRHDWVGEYADRNARVGEGIDDLAPFEPAAYVDALFTDAW